MYPLDGGEPRPIPGFSPGELPISWSSDGRFIYVYGTAELPAVVVKIDVTSGQRSEWKRLRPQPLVLVGPYDEPLGRSAKKLKWVASHQRKNRFVGGSEHSDVIGSNDLCPIYLIVE